MSASPPQLGRRQPSAGKRVKKLGALLSEWERTEATLSVRRAETEVRNEGGAEKNF